MTSTRIIALISGGFSAGRHINLDATLRIRRWIDAGDRGPEAVVTGNEIATVVLESGSGLGTLLFALDPPRDRLFYILFANLWHL